HRADYTLAPHRIRSDDRRTGTAGRAVLACAAIAPGQRGHGRRIAETIGRDKSVVRDATGTGRLPRASRETAMPTGRFGGCGRLVGIAGRVSIGKEHTAAVATVAVHAAVWTAAAAALDDSRD